MVLVVKDLSANAEDIRDDEGLIPGSGRSLGEGHGNSLEYSCLENPMDRGAWRAAVQGISKRLDTTERLTHACTHEPITTADLTSESPPKILPATS